MDEEFRRKIEEASRTLSDADPRLRLKAIRKLTDIGMCLAWEDRPVVVERLARLIEDKEPFIRWNVAIALGMVGHEKGLEALEKLIKDEHANVRFRAALALGLIGDERGIATLEKIIADPYKIGEHAVVRAFTAMALGMMHQIEEALPLLEKLTRDEDPVVRWHASVSLGDVGLKEGLSSLSRLTKDPVPFVRGHTAIAVAQIGDPNGLPILEETLRFTKEQAEIKQTPAEQKMKGVCEKALELLRSLTQK